jgi:excisionase family DNA binding protein
MEVMLANCATSISSSTYQLSQRRKIVSVEEAAHYLQVERQTIYRTLKKWTIPGAFKVGRVWRIDLDELERFLGSIEKYPK